MVEQIKNGQRTDLGFKEAWWNFCDTCAETAATRANSWGLGGEVSPKEATVLLWPCEACIKQYVLRSPPYSVHLRLGDRRHVYDPPGAETRAAPLSPRE